MQDKIDSVMPRRDQRRRRTEDNVSRGCRVRANAFDLVPHDTIQLKILQGSRQDVIVYI